ncbi:porin [Nitrosomonas sp.]|uniref:porin n=1 Tax=Nitrosomonas sp. TaxID=42353 RepID=UPI0025EB9EF2|nr:porin [Nitrosomonas sp.]MCC6917091.1 porin [Nitrosomonas sp.]
MTERFAVTKYRLGLMLFTMLGFSPASAQQLILYVDTVTKQVYTEPGENRIKLGTFQQVKDEPPRKSPEQPSRVSARPETAPVSAPVSASAATASMEQPKTELPSAEKPKEEKKWYDRIGIKGYAQFRYSKSLWGDKDDVSYWQDSSAGPNSSFLIKRVRLAFSGDITDHLYLYLQPDFVSTPAGSSSTHFLQLRDAYADIFFDRNKEFRIRVGQSKVPYGFETIQSSQIRLTLDRNDAMSSCCRDERDIGAFFYWTPAHVRDRFKDIMAKNLKGSGDYGMFAFGVYNGQGANRLELNDGVHLVSRFTYPYQFGNGQILEAGVQAFHGRYVASNGPVATGFTPVMDAPGKGFRDERVGLHAVLYPQPFGLQAEWNWGRGPQLNETQTAISNASLNGGYVQAMYKIDGLRWGTLFPFVRWQYYNGALKSQRNAPRDRVRDLELGLEWQVMKEIELTAVYHMMNRTNVMNAPYGPFKADILRFQLQWNY